MSVYAYKLNLDWKKRTLGEIRKVNINNSDLDGRSLASFCQSRTVLHNSFCVAHIGAYKSSTSKVD